MIRVAITDQGKSLLPRELTSLAQLRAAAEQARSLAAECERLMQSKPDKEGGSKQSGTPYLS